MYEVRKAYGDTFDRLLGSWEDVIRFVQRKAVKMNYGLYRSWELDGAHYFDCGPTVYKVVKKN